MIKITQTLFRFAYRLRPGLYLLTLLSPPVIAETITIGKGSGIVWEGMPFNVTLSGPLKYSGLMTKYPLMSITDTQSYGLPASAVKMIGGYKAYPIAPGVGVVPKAIGTASYYTSNMVPVTYSATLGLPESRGTGANSHLTPPVDRDWAISPSSTSIGNFYSPTAPRTVNISGSWLMVTDGSQKATEVTVKPMYAASFSPYSTGSGFAIILPENLELRISNLECTVNTPTQINFGPVAHDPTAGAELASLSYPITTQCNQESDRVNANINLQFRAISGLYQNAPTKLSLTADGGYITGEIDNGVTGSGRCTIASGVPFDNQAIRIGSITNAQANLTLANQVTWRLCSGGSKLPMGNVDAAAEMLVTFN
ncbi:hypothetical protein [Serratia sp. 14-2641]|uniref:hypothetical protein n=1 Tax=Serratia sp. 14-2641 TaxID=1841657 RepID=UPI000A794801|nr:hypothetical protein [Serratia sp. 14-2641]